jgi:hypothetical protein
VQDAFISFLLRMHETHSCLETMEKMERWIQEHRGDPRGSRLVSHFHLFMVPASFSQSSLSGAHEWGEWVRGIDYSGCCHLASEYLRFC